jgi:hypothetical protein
MKSITVTRDGRVSHDGRKSDEPFSNYLYAVFSNDQRVAEVTHTFRGDELSMRLIGGEWVEADDVIIGGGGTGQPLFLTPAGLRLLERLRAG